MRKKALSLLLVAVMLLSVLPTLAFAQETADIWDGSIATSFAEGDGTESNPYQIATGSQLAYLASIVNGGDNCANKYFLMTSDIDLGNRQWTPIGKTFVNALLGSTPYYCFAGNFDGGNYTISNLVMGSASSPVTADVGGLFGASVGVLKNITLDTVSLYCNAFATSQGYVVGMFGALAGYAAGSISNCHITTLSMSTSVPTSGFVIANWIGGFVGTLDGGASISNCAVEGTIADNSGKGSIGGFVGELGKTSSISYSGANVVVTSTKTSNGAAVGGFIGKGNSETDSTTTINHCYATGNVSGGGYAGGFAGNLSGLNIKNSYATGNVSNSYYGASFAGSDGASQTYYGSVENCYTTGSVSGIQVQAYAFFPQDGTQRSTIANCYYNNNSIPEANETAIGKNISDMSESNFAELLNNGDPTNGWIVNENGTPYSGAEPADYSGVNAAIANIPANLNLYTDATVNALNDAKNAVVTGKSIAEQTTVDGYATAISNAVTALKYKDANYSEVDKAIADANALNKDNYKDFSAVTAAINAVVTGKNITEQDVVNGYATAISNAISALEKKPVETTTNPTDTTKPTDTTSPQTGDTSNIVLWIALLFISGGAVTTLGITKKRKMNSSK